MKIIQSVFFYCGTKQQGVKLRRLQLKPIGEAKEITVNRSSKNSTENYNIIFFVLCKIYALLKTNSVCTKREIYYQYVQFLKSQLQIENAVISISCMLDVPPWDLGVMATSKGLVYGNMKITISTEEIIYCNASGGTLIPQDVNKIRKVKTCAYFILVVEKDAAFQKLLNEDLPNKLTRPFIMITGKGYPDINTRLFVRKLWLKLSIPVFVLVDADPFGIEIMLTYRFGSLNLSHISEHLAVPHLRWLGVHPSEIRSLGISSQPLNDRDISKAGELLKRPYMSSYPQIREELNILLDNKFKAEIEGLIKSPTFLTDSYIPIKFLNQDYI